MRRRHLDVSCVSILAVAVLSSASVAAQGIAGASMEELRAAATVSVPLLADHVEELGGLPVRVVYASVSQTYDEGVFTIRSTRRRLGLGLRAPEVVVLVPGGQVTVSEGTPVIVVGRARTLAGVEVSDASWLGNLDRGILRRIRGRAIVVAGSVLTPDGVELVRAVP
jgi:hypothetical protein